MLSILISFVNKALPLINLIATLFTFTLCRRGNYIRVLLSLRSHCSKFFQINLSMSEWIARSTVNVHIPSMSTVLIIDDGESKTS